VYLSVLVLLMEVFFVKFKTIRVPPPPPNQDLANHRQVVGFFSFP
jgi:hypothetical protein